MTPLLLPLLLLLVKSLCVFALAGLTLLALRRASAASRHLVCLLALAALLALPLAALLALPLFSWTPLSLPVSVPTALPPPPANLTPRPLLPQGEGAGADGTEGAKGRPQTEAGGQGQAAAPTPAVSAPSSQAPPELGAGGPSLLLALWLFGVLLAALRPLLGLWGLEKLHRSSRAETDPAALTVAADCAALLGLSRIPAVRRGDVFVPMTWGLRRPVVVLPNAANAWPEGRLKAVLLHELAHIRRRDWAAHRLADLACALYWFHPLVWLLARRLRAEGEIACDDLVLSCGIPAPDYARHLLDMARALSAAAPVGPVAMARTARVEGRITRMLNPAQNRRALTRCAVSVSLIAAALGIGALAALRPVAQAQAVALPPVDLKTLHYDVTEIGLNGTASDRYFLSGTGTVAGTVYEPNTERRPTVLAFVQPPGQPRLLVGAALGSGYFQFDGFSDTGQIIGRQSGDTGQTWYIGTREALTPFRKTPAFRQLTAAGYTLYDLTGLNSAENLVLNATQKQGGEQAFVSRNGTLTALKPLAGADPYCSAAAINDAGWVAGDSQGQAVLWSGGAAHGLGTLPGYAESEAKGLNERGMVIGRLSRREEVRVSPFAYGERSHAFVSQGGKMQDLGTLPNQKFASANSINDAGQVVGASWSVDPVPLKMLIRLPHHKAESVPHGYSKLSQAFLWQQGKMYNLQQFLPKNSPWRLQSACAINNQGQIVALAFKDSGRSIGLNIYAVLLTPKTP